MKHGSDHKQNLAKVLRWDFDQQSYQLISDEHNQGVKAGIPWKQGPVPEEFAIYGFRPSRNLRFLFCRFQGITGKCLWIQSHRSRRKSHAIRSWRGGQWGRNRLSRRYHKAHKAQQGDGEVHHVAFRLADRQSFSRMARSFWKIWVSRIPAMWTATILNRCMYV